MKASYLKSKHEAGLSYADYVATGNPDQQAGWKKVYDHVALTAEQQALVGGFEREMKVIGVSGVWCGDCVRQGPMMQKIAEAAGASGSGGKVDLRWVDRDEHMDLQEQLKINAGNRVPVLVFCAEDYELVQWYGDKTLSRYRQQAAKMLGAHCPLPGAVLHPGGVNGDELAAELADWVDVFERVHLLLRLSGRLRQKHGD